MVASDLPVSLGGVAPVGLDIMGCTTLFERRSLIVLGPPPTSCS
jgi:hypothetical protein